MKNVKTAFILFIIFAISFNCTNQNEPNAKTAEPINLRQELRKRITQENEFAFELLKQTSENYKEPNLLISPLSVSIALGMTWNGASGETKEEMETTLKISGLSDTDINEYYKVLVTKLPTIDPNTKLTLANSIWYKLGYEVKSGFLKNNTDYFNAEIREIDFSKTWAVDTINNWCARETNNLIPEVLDEIPSNAVMYLVNAVYFKGIWQKQFDKKNTSSATFTTEENKVLNVNMMHLKDTFDYYYDNIAQYIDLPYGNNAFSMTIMLPVAGKTVSDLIANINIESWNDVLKKFKNNEVDFYLPRFTCSNKYLLNEPLMNMGMVSAFDERADFSGIADDGIMISRVLHDTFIEVNEEGTEAGAVTLVEIIKSMPEYPVFKVNKPFVYVIREKSTGIILFIGKMGVIEK